VPTQNPSHTRALLIDSAVLIGLSIFSVALFFITRNGIFIIPLPMCLAIVIALWITVKVNNLYQKTGLFVPIAFGTILASLIGTGIVMLWLATRRTDPSTNLDVTYMSIGLSLFALAAVALVFGFIEYVFLRLLSLTRLGAIARVTYYEALLQPFSLIVLGIGSLLIAMLAFLPFFTISEDTKMYRDVATSFAFLPALMIMIFASSKVIDEEIENRTMLTLMSKPVARWQVVIGKYLGVFMLVFVAVATLAIIGSTCAYLRYFDDQRIDFMVARSNATELYKLLWTNQKAVLALIPANLLQCMQLASLAAVSVALSTRWGLALNITVIVLLYIASNLTRYIPQLGLEQPWDGIVTYVSYLLPSLGNLDLSQRLIYGEFNFGKEFMNSLSPLPSWGQIWNYVGVCLVYTVFYVSAALSFAVALFRTRELI